MLIFSLFSKISIYRDGGGITAAVTALIGLHMRIKRLHPNTFRRNTISDRNKIIKHLFRKVSDSIYSGGGGTENVGVENAGVHENTGAITYGKP